MQCACKKPLRTPGPIRKSPFTGGAEAHRGHQTERRGGRHGGPDGRRRNEGLDPEGLTHNLEMDDAGCAKVGASGRFCLRSLKSRVSEEICGRLGHTTDGPTHVALLGLRSDDEVSASLFGGFGFLWKTDARQTELFRSLAGSGRRCAEVRTSRTGKQLRL